MSTYVIFQPLWETSEVYPPPTHTHTQGSFQKNLKNSSQSNKKDNLKDINM